MDQLDDRSQAEPVLPAITQGATDQQQQGRAQSLATGCNDVLGDLRHEGHAGRQALGNDMVHFAHVVGDDRQWRRGGRDEGGGQDRVARRKCCEL
ncbi:MAG: hypothetical protein ACD_23C00558G0001 [uncultured bacterium]|nr:MAG: hypothetical protein ACD_23C00558G0001 [uncultured bacterium]